MRVISGYLKGRNIKGINIKGTRPTMDRVKESMFAIIQKEIPNSICLDLFSGSGSLAIEAISNGADYSYLVDNSNVAIKTIKENIISLNIINKCKILNQTYTDALNYFYKNNIKFNVIFIDPPYDMHIINDILMYISTNDLLYDNGVIVCEIDKLYLEDNINNLKKIKEKKYGTNYLSFYKKK